MSHITHVDESRHTWGCVVSQILLTSRHMCWWVMSHILMCRVTHVDESCHTCGYVVTQMLISHVTHVNAFAWSVDYSNPSHIITRIHELYRHILLHSITNSIISYNYTLSRTLSSHVITLNHELYHHILLHFITNFIITYLYTLSRTLVIKHRHTR